MLSVENYSVIHKTLSSLLCLRERRDKKASYGKVSLK